MATGYLVRSVTVGHRRACGGSRTAVLAALILAVLAATRVSGADGIVKLNTGFEYSTGDYGLDQDTDIWYVPLSLKYDTFPWVFRVTIPWLQIDGPGGVVVGGDGTPIVIDGQARRERATDSGLGDIVAAVTYGIVPRKDSPWPFVDLTGKIKFGTADPDKGLGTGETDYILQLDLAKIYGDLTPLGTLGYKLKGDSPDLTLRNVWFATLGFSYRLHPSVSAGLLVDWQESSTKTSDDLLEATPFLNWKLAKSWSVNVYGIAGFSDSSPDWGLGAQVTYSH